MTILGIETSCDETAAAVVEGTQQAVILKSNVVASSMKTHAQTGGVIPENAARQQLIHILPVIQQALKEANTSLHSLDAIGVTYGPGLIGSLLVGVETARTLAFVHHLPLVPVNHMIGHVYANWLEVESKEHKAPATLIASEIPSFPALALIVSGGHTDLLLLQEHGDFRLLGGTRDDAAGEAFDKIARLIGIASYPGGPAIEKAAMLGDPKRFSFPRPLIGSPDFDFSFSGLKTAVLREVRSLKTLDTQTINDLARATQDAVIDVLVKKTIKAAQRYQVKSIVLSGGVSANQTLRQTLELSALTHKLAAHIFAPQKFLCTDNAAMIASATYFNYHPLPWQEVIADPELYFE